MYIPMIETRLVQRFGNGAHVVLPKGYIGRRLKFLLEPKTFEDIRLEILDILSPYLSEVIGIYLYGSYARNEQGIESDIDILVVTTSKLKLIDKVRDYTITSATIGGIENALRNNAVLILPILEEAKPILNSGLLEKYRGMTFTKRNTEYFIRDTGRILKINQKGLELDFEIGSLVYSLILRIRGLLMIKLMFGNKTYSKSALFGFLSSKFEKGRANALYAIYTSEKNSVRVRESNIISKEDAKILLAMANGLLMEIRALIK